MSIALLFSTIVPAAFAGVTWGILGGALPGISPSITMALLLPLTYGMDPTFAIVMMAATYVGAEYGGSIPAILIRTPGTNAAVATVTDGYAMKQQGRAGEALGISLYSGLVGGLFGLTVLVLLTEPLSILALAFTPPAYFALGVMGLSIIASLSRESLVKGLMAGLLGLMIATIGTDPVTGLNRFTFDSPELLSGIPPILVMVGLFAVSELLVQTGAPAWQAVPERARIRFPGPAMLRRIALPQGIGAVVGTVEGIMPGSGGAISSFLAYNEARRWSRRQEEFGHGLSGRHRGAGNSQQYGGLHGADADAESWYSRLEFVGGPAWRLPDARAAARADVVRPECRGRGRPLRGPADGNRRDGHRRIRRIPWVRASGW